MNGSVCYKVILFTLLILATAYYVQAQEIEEVFPVEAVEFQPTEHQLTQIDQIRLNATEGNFEEIDPIWQEMAAKSSDVQILAQAILYQVMKDEQKTLEEVMQALHEMNEMKRRQREYIEELKKKKVAIKDSLRREYEEMHASPEQEEVMLHELPELQEVQEQIQHAAAKLDSVKGESESRSLRLQMLVNRRAKIIHNLLKILEIDDDTRDQIIKNIK